MKKLILTALAASAISLGAAAPAKAEISIRFGHGFGHHGYGMRHRGHHVCWMQTRIWHHRVVRVRKCGWRSF